MPYLFIVIHRFTFKILLFSIVLMYDAVFAQEKHDTCGLGILSSIAANLLKKDPAHMMGSKYSNKFQFDSFRVWLIEKNKPCSTIVADIENRYSTLVDAISFSIDTNGVLFAGKKDAPITVVMYVSMSCPLCKRLYGELSDSLAADPHGLGRIFRLGIKPFTTTRFDRVLVAAGHFGCQTQLLKSLASVKERISEKIITRVLDSLGVVSEKLWSFADAKQTVSYVEASRTEAIKNMVEITPTFFINGHRYRSYKDSRWLIDAIRFESSCSKAR